MAYSRGYAKTGKSSRRKGRKTSKKTIIVVR